MAMEEIEKLLDKARYHQRNSEKLSCYHEISNIAISALEELIILKSRNCNSCEKTTNCKIEEWYFDRKWAENKFGCIHFKLKST